ncbi:DUF4030 domain-containing protein [Alkalihalobacillus sp. R86527]|uniref:DUF4030 domain-containing protein n=1 Tax=Alkalihalobacillus sp. R86527 TaxID=3093863 RepID=UPI00366A560C
MKKRLTGLIVIVCIAVCAYLVFNYNSDKKTSLYENEQSLDSLERISEDKDNVVDVISEELRAKGFNTTGLGVSFPDKIIDIRIGGSQKYVDSVKGDIEKIVKDILQSKNYDAYTFKVSRDKEHKFEMDGKVEKDLNEFNIISTAITEELRKLDYTIESLGMSYDPKTIELEIPNSEDRIDEIKQVISNILKVNNLDSISLKITKVDINSKDLDERWAEILSIVSEDLLGKKDYKVKKVGYSVNPEPKLQMYIDLPSTGENSKNFAQQLEKVIDDFLKSEKMKPIVNNDPYQITIYSKDEKIIN